MKKAGVNRNPWLVNMILSIQPAILSYKSAIPCLKIYKSVYDLKLAWDKASCEETKKKVKVSQFSKFDSIRSIYKLY